MREIFPGMSDPSFRWLPRILGSLIGLVALGEFIEGLGYLGQLDTSGILVRIGFFIVFAGCAAGWFQELVGALLILGGTGLCWLNAGVRAVLFLPPAVVGLLYLFVYLSGKRARHSE